MSDSIFAKWRADVEKNVSKNEEKVETTDEVIAKPDIVSKYLEKADVPIARVEVGLADDKAPRVSDVSKNENEEVAEKVQSMLQKQAGIFDRLKKTEAPKKEIKGLKNVEYEEHNPRFMKQFPRHELLHKDHSGIIVAKGCLRKYFYREVINLVPRENNVIFLPWGTAYHIFQERLSELYGYGENEPPRYDEEKAKASFKQAASEATKYWHEHGEDQKVGTKYDWFTTERFYASCVEAFEFWVNERKLGRVKIISIEQYFNVQIKDGRYVQGRTDEVVEIKDELWGRDYKSTSKPQEWFKNGLNPNNQIRTYTYGTSKLASRHVRGLLIQALYNGKSTKKGDKGPDVFEEIIEVSDYELNIWEEEQVQWNNILELCREKDIWPQNESQCSWCEYRIVCSKSSEASMVYTLENKFQHRLRDPSRSEEE